VKLQRRALALLLGMAAILPGVAAAAAPPPSAPPRTAAAQQQSADWWVTIQSYLDGDALIVGKKILLSLLCSSPAGSSPSSCRGSSTAACVGPPRQQAGREAAPRRPDRARPGHPGRPAAKPPPPNALERFIASVVFYMLMLLVVVGVLQFAGLSQAAGPIQGLVDTVVQALPLVGKAVIILLVAYFGGLLLGRLLSKALAFMRVDSRFAELGPDRAGRRVGRRRQHPAVLADRRRRRVLARHARRPRRRLRRPAHHPDLRAPQQRPRPRHRRHPLGRLRRLLVLAGYILGRVVRVVVHNLLDSLGVNRLIDRIGLGRLFGASKPSAVLGLLAMTFIMFQASIAALNELGLVTLSGPLTEMMSRFWVVLPNLAVSVLVIAAGVVIGRIIRNVVAATLRNLGFDRLVARLGISTISARPDKLGEPAELAGFLVHVAIIILATAQACENLQLHTWAVYLNAFLGYAIKNVLVAMVVVGVGVAIGNYVRDLIAARSPDPLDNRNRWLGEFARYTDPRVRRDHGDPAARHRRELRPPRLRPAVRRPVPRLRPRLRPRRPRGRQRDRPQERPQGRGRQARDRDHPDPLEPQLDVHPRRRRLDPPVHPPSRRGWPRGQPLFFMPPSRPPRTRREPCAGD
jgi:hypothetical protein